MGNSVGYLPHHAVNRYLHPEVTPAPYENPTFDPSLGFSGPRKERKMIATERELTAAKIPLKDRDYCAHLLIDFRACRKQKWPWVVKCAHEKHTYLNCQYDDFVLRMKEYERERRLLEREHKQVKVN
ncbi:hypothetical protein FQA39_LY01300 [Lamprigera yunnana]|nr:hypothetical protein FQA39_LY01300 [Lamprigera yunnana]